LDFDSILKCSFQGHHMIVLTGLTCFQDLNMIAFVDLLFQSI
jgi:hypothetical protein